MADLVWASTSPGFPFLNTWKCFEGLNTTEFVYEVVTIKTKHTNIKNININILINTIKIVY